MNAINAMRTILEMSHSGRILLFFVEHPRHEVTVSAVANYLKISRDTVAEDLSSMEMEGFVQRSGPRGRYSLAVDDENVQIILAGWDAMSQKIVEAQTVARRSESPCTGYLDGFTVPLIVVAGG